MRAVVELAAYQQPRPILPKLLILVLVYVKTNTEALKTYFVAKT